MFLGLYMYIFILKKINEISEYVFDRRMVRKFVKFN